MGSKTSIEWTDSTWNPVVGCTRVSEGCRACYAFALHEKRHKAYLDGKKMPAQYAKPFTDVQIMPDRLDQPLRWRKPRRIFVNSLSDLFHEDVPNEFIDQVFAVMGSEEAGHHIYQVLTKRPERMLRYTQRFSRHGIEFDKLFSRVWLGVSIEGQRTADERIPLLLQTPAAVRFVSAEPLLGPLDLSRHLRQSWPDCNRNCLDDAGPGHGVSRICAHSPLPALDWVIVGGESGPGARPCDVAWIRSIVQQCRAAGVKCFVKQLGSRSYYYQSHGEAPVEHVEWLRLKDKKGGDPLEWPADLRVRELP